MVSFGGVISLQLFYSVTIYLTFDVFNFLAITIGPSLQAPIPSDGPGFGPAAPSGLISSLPAWALLMAAARAPSPSWLSLATWALLHFLAA